MKKRICKRICVGAALPLVALVLARWLIRSLGGLFGWLGPLAGLDEGTVAYVVQVLSQLRDASLTSPWLPVLLLGAAAGALTALLPRPRRKHPVLCGIVLVLLLLPLTLAGLWFTGINCIRLGALLSAWLPMLPHLL